MLSAIARLNPHVDMKKIVIGLMDRLSTFAQRESEASSPEEKQKAEEDAAIRLMETMRISRETKSEPAKTEGDTTEDSQPNGTKAEEGASDASESIVSQATTAVNGDGDPSKPSTTPTTTDVKLYEIFYDQVVNLVKTRGLSIQDTMALLTSLMNLAL